MDAPEPSAASTSATSTPADPTAPDLTSSISTQTDDAPAIRERQAPISGPAQTIAAGMEVIAADGAHLGTVETVDGDEITLARGDGDAEHRLLPLSLVDVVSDDQVMMLGGGNAAFGVQA